MSGSVSTSERAVGIDLGSTYCRVAVAPQQLDHSLTARGADYSLLREPTPSFIAEDSSGVIVVGRKADDNWAGLGTAKLLGFGSARVALRATSISCDEMLARFLRHEKELAKSHLQEQVDTAAIAVPVWFSAEEK